MDLCFRDAGRLLSVSSSALSDWNKCFDEGMRPFFVPENRGKASKIGPEVVRVIVEAAEEWKEKGKRVRVKEFARHLRDHCNVELSRKKVGEVLTANGLFSPRSRKRRPQFYQSLRKEIPNGLLSLDGSAFTVWVDAEGYTFNVELAVDAKTFHHTAYSVGATETSDEVIKVLEAHRKNWGDPLGVVFDYGTSNLSGQTLDYLKEHAIEVVPAGPGNPKGNGTDEGAFSQLKKVLGEIRLDLTSPRQLARCVLEKLIGVYITMRNRTPKKGACIDPDKEMKEKVCEEQRQKERQHLQAHARKKQAGSAEDREKLQRLDTLVRYHGIGTEDPVVLSRAQSSITRYELAAIEETEEAFTKAVNRHPSKKTLAYFFGILKRIQGERDAEAYRRYSYERYNQKMMAQVREQQQPPQDSHSVEGIVNMLARAVKATVDFVRQTAMRKAHEWTQELMATYRYQGVLKHKLVKAVDGLSELTIEQRDKVRELIEGIISPKITPESVTRIS